jgi:hypothetical protein
MIKGITTATTARNCRAIIFLSAVAVILLCVGTAGAAGPGAAWRVAQTSEPTVLKAGSQSEGGYQAVQIPQFNVVATNVGGGPTEGPITLTDTLPAGVTPSATLPPVIRNQSPANPETVCPLAVGQVVNCTLTEEVEPGTAMQLFVPIDVASNAPPVVENKIVITGGNAPAVATSSRAEVASGFAIPPFYFLPAPEGLSISAADEGGVGANLAGSHPYELEVEAGYPTRQIEGEEPGNNLVAAEAVKHLSFELPQGIVFNPRATTAKCSEAELVSEDLAVGCPAESQVGQVHLRINNISGTEYQSTGIYNIQPPPGSAAELGFNIFGSVIHVQGGISSHLRLTAESNDILAKVSQSSATVTLWGNPSDPRHDIQRKGPGCRLGCSIEPSPAALLTMPTSCSAIHSIAVAGLGWLGGEAATTALLTDPNYAAMPIKGCASTVFAPTIAANATTDAAESPSGLDFNIHQPQDNSVDGRSPSTLKDATVTLPEGMNVNPSAANGLESCTEQQMGFSPSEGKNLFSTLPQNCPQASKVGTLEASTPLLDNKLPGSIYLAKPFDNPFGSLLALYLAVEDETTGIVVKLAGKVEPDPNTGQLTARFTENPELPLEDVDLHFFGGDRATLTTPVVCGTHTTTTTLTPWSSPEGADAHPTSSFQVKGGCADSEGAAPKTVDFKAGAKSPLSGSYSPFVLYLARPDGSQHLTGIDMTLPEGLLGKLAGIAYCPESAIEQARSREEPEKGKLEQSSPSCPSSSEVGTVNVTAGSGGSPIPVSGHAYLAGPYKGAPLSLVVVVPAVAGPFDLGTVVDRVALNVGEYDAKIHAVADPLPTIRDGIPLDVRSIDLSLDRSNFTLNPTSCEAMQIEGVATTQAGQTQPLSNRFQVGECNRLGFKPSLKLSLKGATKRTGHPALKAVVTYPKSGQYANIARAQVSLPHSEFLDQGNLNLVCKQADLKAGTCPTKAIYGKVKAWTPLLDKPLEGNVYLGVGFGYKLPAVVAELNGQIRVLLKGKVDTDKKKGLRNTFEAVPDAPVERFVLEMKGGKKYGLLENSENICKKKQIAGAAFGAQNGKKLSLSVPIANSCKKPKSKHNKKKH